MERLKTLTLTMPNQIDRGKCYDFTQRLEGWRRWVSVGRFSFEATPANIKLFRDYYPEKARQLLEDPAKAENLAPEGDQPFGARVLAYQQATSPYAHQERALAQARKNKVFALFMEQGTGKTKVAIDRCGELWAANKIESVLVVTRKGIHSQWAKEQIPLHLGGMVPRHLTIWGDRKNSTAGTGLGALKFLLINIDALNTQNGFLAARNFLAEAEGRSMMIIDESHIIKNHRARRTSACYQLGRMSSYRMIMTGTPIAKDLSDEWSQFKFLDEAILGYRYLTSFRQQYCVMGGFEGKQVVGHRNLNEFKAKVAPYSFRITKEEELDLPPKVYAEVPFEMAAEQRLHYNRLKKTFMSQLENGEIVSVQNAVSLLVRLQQITCGLITDGDNAQELANPRLEALLDLLEQRQGKAVIWARFTHDIERIKRELGERAVTFYGETSQKQRDEAKAKFLDKNSGVDYFVSNPAAGGVGLNLQGDCRTAIYYSNSFNAIDRWQSEDRIHRIGATGTVTYFDLVCIGSPDRSILRNLRNKKSLSDLALSDLKGIIEDEN